MHFDWSVIQDALPELFAGVQLTVLIAVAELLGGSVVGALAGLCRAYGPMGPMPESVNRPASLPALCRVYGARALNAIALVYIELIRGTPIIVQVMFLYFVLPVLAHLRIGAIPAAIIGLAPIQRIP